MDPTIPTMPVVNTPTPLSSEEKKVLTKKNVLAGLLVAVLLLSVPFGVSLIKQQTQLKSKATFDSDTAINFAGDNVQCHDEADEDGVKCLTNETTVQVALKSPWGPYAAIENTPTPSPTGAATNTPAAGATNTPVPTQPPDGSLSAGIYVTQSFIDQNGTDSWFRKCQIATSGGSGAGFISGSCGNPMDNYIPLSIGDPNHRGTGKYWGYDAYTYTLNSKTYLVQSIFDQNGVDSWWRKCEIGNAANYVGNAGLYRSTCDRFEDHYVPLSVGDTNHPGTGKFGAYGAYTYKVGEKTYLVQSLLDQNGTDSWYRRCELDGSTSNGTKSGSCDNFADHYVLISIGDPSHPGTKKYSGYGAYTYLSGDKTYLVQSIFDQNGVDSWWRRCELDGSTFNGVKSGSCDRFEDHYVAMSIGNTAHPGTGKLADYGVYAFEIK